MSIKANSFLRFLNEGMMDEVQGFSVGWFCVCTKGMCLGLEALAKRVAYALMPNFSLLGPSNETNQEVISSRAGKPSYGLQITKEKRNMR